LKRKGYAYFPRYFGPVSTNIGYIESSTAIGTSLFAGSFSVSFFLKPFEGQPTSTSRYTIFYDVQNVGTPNNSRVLIRLEGQSVGNALRAYIAVGGTLKQALTSTPIFTTGTQLKEKHIAVTFTNGDFIRIYVDGVLQTLDATLNGSLSGINLSSYVNNTNKLMIGATRDSTIAFPLNGHLRDFIIQPGVVYSQSDINNLMTN